MNIKNLIGPIILGLTMSSSFAACLKPEKKEYTLLSALSYAQDYPKMEELLNKYCYDFSPKNEDRNGALIVSTSAKGLALIESKTQKKYANMATDHNGMDLFSIVLLDDVMVSEKVKKDTILNVKKLISQNYPNYDTSKITEKLREDGRKDLLKMLAKEYYQEITLNQDVRGNSALTYVISTNQPEYLEASLGQLNDKKAFIKLNKYGVSPLHIAFSPVLKGKNTEELSKKLINTVPVSYMINNVIWNYDYFQFAEAFKENNPTFYKMLKDKYKFEVKTSMDPKIKENIKKSLNIYWEVDDK